MRGYHFWTDSERAEAHALYLETRDYVAVGLRFGVTASAIATQIKVYRRGLGLAKPHNVVAEKRAAVDKRLTETWQDPQISIHDLSVETGLCYETLRRYAYSLGLGRKAFMKSRSEQAREISPDPPSGKGGDYAGRRYEDHPRDPKPTVYQRPQGPAHGSWCGSAAAMCAEG